MPSLIHLEMDFIKDVIRDKGLESVTDDSGKLTIFPGELMFGTNRVSIPFVFRFPSPLGKYQCKRTLALTGWNIVGDHLTVRVQLEKKSGVSFLTTLMKMIAPVISALMGNKIPVNLHGNQLEFDIKSLQASVFSTVYVHLVEIAFLEKEMNILFETRPISNGANFLQEIPEE